MNDELNLVRRAQRGDATAFEKLVDCHARYVYNLTLRLVQDPQEAEDLAQEAFLNAWRGLKSFRAEAKFSTWLYRIVTNVCYNRLPRLKRELAQLTIEVAGLDWPDGEGVPEATYIDKELLATVHQMIDELPEGFRLLITLRHLQEMSYSEIADVTGMPLGTVKTGLHRARRLLREAMKAYAYER